MITRIIANFLKIDENQASSLLKLLIFEKRFQQPATHKGNTINPADIRTEADLIKFLEIVGQSKWFQNHDRSAFTLTNDDQINQMYYALFASMGLTRECSVTDELKGTNPDVAVILGSTEQQVKHRLQYFKKDLEKTIIPNTNYVVGLGCNRRLGKLSIDKEKESITQLTQITHKKMAMMTTVPLNNLETVPVFSEMAWIDRPIPDEHLTEASMVDLQSTQAIKGFSNLNYVGINTATNTVNVNDNKARATTADTAVSLKAWLDANVVKTPKKVTLAVYSNSPFIARQALDMQLQLGNNYQVIGLGSGLSVSEFETHLRNKIPGVNICLGEIARLTHTRYDRAVKNNEMANYASKPLNEDALAELANLRTTSGLSDSDQQELLAQYQILKSAEKRAYIPQVSNSSFALWQPAPAANALEEMVGYGTKPGTSSLRSLKST